LKTLFTLAQVIF